MIIQGSIMERKRIYGILILLLFCGMAKAQVIVKGNVYGGGEIGKVTVNTSVTINGGIVNHTVFGGGMGDTTDVDAGLVKGNTLVTMTGGQVRHSVYGGGELGSVGTFTGTNTVTYPASDTNGNAGKTVVIPTVCTPGTGLTKVLISGGKVGIDTAHMPHELTPGLDDYGYVFCGGMGMADSIHNHLAIGFAVNDTTYLQISDSALITASAYGGSENGLVLRDTRVKMSGGQIGTGHYQEGSNHYWDPAYTDQQWKRATDSVRKGTLTDAIAEQFHNCDHWPYDRSDYKVYDIYANDYPSGGGSIYATNGHSFFGNLFGGGSGYYPIAPGVWRRTAGRVNGNVVVDIEGGHILTCVYGGNEYTDVLGKVSVNMTGGTVGVPRTVENIQNNPVTGMLFGAGMGDPRVAFNTWTNIPEVEVNVTDSAVIFGSIYGGGEDGHVLGDVKVTVDADALIGIWGTSGFDGNVFGAGRGFGGEAYTAGTVKGNVNLDINGGTMLGSIYGGGRIASVGLHLVDTLDANYGKFVEDAGGKTYGYVTVNINGGTIGNTLEAPTGHTEGGNVYGGSMGRILNVDLTTENHLWPGMARVKHATVNLNSDTAVIKGNVYGGAELGIVRDSAIVLVNGGIVNRNVYGGGYGSLIDSIHDNDSTAHPAKLAGLVQGHTLVKMIEGQVKGNIYGGGELASVGYVKNNQLQKGNSNVVLSGGSVGVDTVYTADNYFNNTIPTTEIGHVYGGSEGYANDTVHQAYGNVNYTKVTLSGTAQVYGSVFGGGSNSHVLGNDSVFISAGAVLGTSGVTSWDGNVFGGGQGSGYYVIDDSGSEPDTTFQVYKTCGRVEGNTYVKMDGGTLMGSIFGGGRLALTGVDVNGDYNNDNTKGLATVYVDGGTLGLVYGAETVSNDSLLLKSDESVGDVFGSGKGDTENYDDVWAGRVTNANVTITGNAVVRGGVFGGGEMASVGYWNNSGTFENGTGITEVTIGTQNTTHNPQIGLDHEFTVGAIDNPGQWTIYDTLLYVINNETYKVVKIAHTATGNVYGAGQGDVDPEAPHWISMAHSNTSSVTVYGGTIKSNVYGGAEQGTVKGNSSVTVYGGTIGHTAALVCDTIKPNNSVTQGSYYFGSVYGGGYGSDNLVKHWNDLCTKGTNDTTYVYAAEIAGRTYGNTSVTISGGKVVQDVYGGGDIASVGQDGLVDGKCTVVVDGGDIGFSTLYDTDPRSKGGHVFGGGRGIHEDGLKQFNKYCNVNNTKVTIADDGKVWGSVFGGAAYGHVIGNDSVYIASDTVIGTQGKSSYDGNVYGGGRGNDYNLAAGRVGGNTFVEMTSGKVLGCIYGGGCFGITGIDTTGLLMQDGDEHGFTKVLVKGGIVGNNAKTNNPDDPDEIVIETFADFSMGSIYGGGKGDLNRIVGHPVESTLLRGSVKNTEVEISQASSSVPTRVYGIVYGGGEVANVGKYTWSQVGTNPFANINIVDSTGYAKVTITGGIIGGDRSQMRDSLVSDNPNDDNYWTFYNDDLGYVYGGGEGVSEDPTGYPLVNSAFGDNYLIDLMATVNNTEVTISNTAWVKGSVFGGGEAGHVRGNTLVKIQGGQIGAGAGTSGDLRYNDGDFVNPLTTPITEANALSGTVHWIFGDTLINGSDTTVSYNPFDLVSLKHGVIPSDGKSWFGNVFGGGSGWFPYVVNPGTSSAACAWNPLAGKVWGNTHVIVEGGHVLNNVYGANESTDVGGNSLVEIKGGTVGVPRTPQQINDQPCSGFVFGGGSGDPRDVFDTITLVDSTDVRITGGIVYGSVFGGAEDGHVLGSTKVTVNQSTGTTVIGSAGLSTADGNVFGGGRNFLGENNKAGRVQGNIEVNMTSGTLMGSIFGGGRMALSGVNVNGEFPTSNWDRTKHGNVTINVSGGEIGNSRDQGIHLLCDNDESVGDIFGSGKGDTKNYANNKSGRVTNATINITGNPTINGAVFGGGEMASLGWWNETDGAYYDSTGKATVIIGREGETDNPVIGTVLELDPDYLNNNFTTSPGGIHYNRSKWTMVDSVLVDNVKRVRLVHTCTGNVFGGCQGDVDFEGWDNSDPNTWNDWPHMGRSNESEVTVYGGTIMSGVFGGSEQGTVAGNTKVTIKGGIIGNEVTDSKGAKYNFGDVYGAGYGSDDADEDERPITFFGVDTRTDSVAGRVFGNAQADIFGGTLRSNVFGGAAFAYVGTDSENLGTTVNIGDTTQANYTITGNVYGGNNRDGSVVGSVNVNVNAGNLGNATGNRTDVFGGGYGEYTRTAGDVNVTVKKLGTTAPIVYGDIYGGSAFGSVNDNVGNDTTRVNILNGTIMKSTTRDVTYGGDVYGGGLGETGNDTKGQVNGVIQVNVGQFAQQTSPTTNADTTVYFGYATIGNNVYGGNNSGGSPQENVVVNLYGTDHVAGVNGVDDDGYAIDQLFGGGNFASHEVAGKTAYVNIFGCDNTVRRVFGGGDAAASQNVSTDIQGGRFDQVFGGGNGDRGPSYPAEIYGDVTLAIHGGNVNMFFVGSNQNGTIHGQSSVTVDDSGPCGQEMDINEFFCGGNYVDVNGNVEATISCANGMTVRSLYGGCNQANVNGNVHLIVQGGSYQNVYGGSKGRLADNTVNPPITEKAANITGDVLLEIQGGTIDTVFGGCNVLGNIDGSITINVLDTVRNCPTVIHNVYGGGRNASYTPTTAGAYPEINILKGTISQDTINTAQGQVLTGGNVFGGGFGSSAVVTSNPKVTIGSHDAAHSNYEAVVEGNVYGGGHGAEISGNTRVILDGTSKVDIKGNVYGGGSQAVVTGDTKVEIIEPQTTQP